MHILKPNHTTDKQTIIDTLQFLIDQPSAAELPPCENCTIHVPDECSATCANAQGSLSSEPTKFPIEEKVVPLVFELAASRVLQTCWSCEGHFTNEGKLWKLPQVVFYANSPIYPQLLLRHIQALQLKKVLAYEWQVVLSDFGQSWNFSYNIEPKLNGVSEPRLGALQQDLQTISKDLSHSLKALAKAMLDDVK